MRGHAWRERREWERYAWQTAHLINMSGRVARRRVKASELLDGGSGGYDPIQRARDMELIKKKLSQRENPKGNA